MYRGILLAFFAFMVCVPTDSYAGVLEYLQAAKSAQKKLKTSHAAALTPSKRERVLRR